jgi:hypothetical protein
MALVVKTLPVWFLATYRLICEEAAPCLVLKLDTLPGETSRFIIDSRSFYSFVYQKHSICTMFEK